MQQLSHERWQQVDALLGQALDLDPAEREPFLEGIGDDEARRAVAQLLTADALDFLEDGAVEFAAPLLPDVGDGEEVIASPDDRVGPYRIVGEIGRGGMGRVYKARHDSLGRYAALKFLPPHLATNDAMREQLLAEAQAAAALDHPNICTVYDIGEADDGRRFIAMTYYEGETLRAEIARGPLSVEQAVGRAVQVAEGLAAAHAVGIAHRDVKPANVIVTADGTVKLLDFGLAKLEGIAVEPGKRWGTIAYMSPERARGGEADHRADIWSLGVMLYEMLTGTRPFGGDHGRVVLDRILHEEPESLSSVRPDVPSALVRVVEQALAKEPSERYAGMAGMLADLRGVQQDMGLSAGGQRPGAGRLRWGVLVAAGVIAVLVLAAVFVRSGDDKAPNSSASYLKVTTSGNALLPELSPDGTSIAYVERESETEHRVVMQDVSGENRVVVLEECYDCWNLRWVPDGSGLSFSALVDPGGEGPANFFVPRQGGELERLDPYMGLFSWSPDGSRYAGASPSNKQIVIVDRATGDIMERLDLDRSITGFRGVDWSPKGDRLLFSTRDSERRFAIWTVALDGSNVHKVAEASLGIFSPRWAADGRGIYYMVREGTSEGVMRVPIDPHSGAPAGPAEPFLVGLKTDDSFSLSGDGTQLAYARASLSAHLWRLTIERPGTEAAVSASPLTTGTSWSDCPSISPDGQHVAFHRANIYVMPMSGGDPRKVTDREGQNVCPVWSPDGQTLAFSSDQGRGFRLWTVGVEDGTLRSFAQPSKVSTRLAWAPRAQILYRQLGSERYYALDPETGEAMALSADSSGAWRRAFGFPYARNTPAEDRATPQGERVESSQLGAQSLGVETDAATASQASGGMRTIPLGQSADGDWFYAMERGVREANLMMTHAVTGERRLLAAVPEEIRVGLRHMSNQVTMAPDGKHFVFVVRQVHASDIVLVENLDPAMR